MTCANAIRPHVARMTTKKWRFRLQLVGNVKNTKQNKKTEDVVNPVCDKCGRLGHYIYL